MGRRPTGALLHLYGFLACAFSAAACGGETTIDVGTNGGGGSTGSAGAGGLCNNVESKAPVAGCVSPQGEPEATGGIIPDGMYHLEFFERRDCEIFSQTSRITQTAPNRYLIEGVTEFEQMLTHSNAVWTASGSQFDALQTCGPHSDTTTWDYSVLNDTALTRIRVGTAPFIYYVRVGN